jgi:hypothetical protein
MNDTIATTDAPRAQRLTASGERIDVDLLRGFLKRALSDDALVDRVNDVLFDHVVGGGRVHPSVVATRLSRVLDEVHLTATEEDWQAVATDLIAEARELEGAEIAPLRFIDHHRQRYAAKVPIADAGEFFIGAYHEDGSVDRDGEFRVVLMELMHGRGPALTPRLDVFGEGEGALRRAVEAGMLEALRPVSSRDEFARRLLAMGMVDGSDSPLPGGDRAEA